ncbi:hypothetical protein FRC12_014468 [Ceratobasidium sp. 428]|nr:hypothetical protein FRC12_014468 [Ceratobasidium sp. 428]
MPPPESSGRSLKRGPEQDSGEGAGSSPKRLRATDIEVIDITSSSDEEGDRSEVAVRVKSAKSTSVEVIVIAASSDEEADKPRVAVHVQSTKSARVESKRKPTKRVPEAALPLAGRAIWLHVRLLDGTWTNDYMKERLTELGAKVILSEPRSPPEELTIVYKHGRARPLEYAKLHGTPIVGVAWVEALMDRGVWVGRRRFLVAPDDADTLQQGRRSEGGRRRSLPGGWRPLEAVIVRSPGDARRRKEVAEIQRKLAECEAEVRQEAEEAAARNQARALKRRRTFH